MPTAARWPCAAPSSLSSSRLGLISAKRDGKQARALVVVDHDHVEPGGFRLLERVERLRAAIDADGDASAARLQLDERLARRAIAFHQPVGDVDDRLRAELPEQEHEQRRAGRPVDVVIAEDGDGLAAWTASASRLAPLSMSWKQLGSGRKSRMLRIAVAGEIVARDSACQQQFVDQRVHSKRRRPAAAASATAGRSRICRC